MSPGDYDKLSLYDASRIDDDDRGPGRYLVKVTADSEWEILNWDDGWLLEFGGFIDECGVYDVAVCYGPLP
jgi:hypothetical protein